MSADDDAALRDKGMNRVTDVAIPEAVISSIEKPLMELWEEAEAVGDRRFPHETSTICCCTVTWSLAQITISLG